MSLPATSTPRANPKVETLEDRSLPSTYWVSNTLDAGAGSLRAAVAAANAHPGSDDIRFRPSAWGTITLASELLLTDAVDIDGPGAGKLTVSGGNATRVFNVAAGVTASIEDLTVANGKVTGTRFGAGILNAGTLTLENSVVTGNVADRGGGGIDNSGTLTVNRSSVTANRTGTAGGGIHNAGTGVAVIDRSTVINNTCVGDGAGILTDHGSTLTVTRSTVRGNVATGYGTGGIASYGGVLTLDDTLVAENVSAAAGIYLFSYPDVGSTVITNSVIRDNGKAGVSGVGAIWSDDFFGVATIRIENTVIQSNTGRTAGGIYGGGQFDIVTSTIDGNRGTSTFGGGAMYVFGNLHLTRSTVSNNSGAVGGISSFGPTTISESTISGNSGVTVGGISAYDLDLVRSTVSGNTATPTGEVYYSSLGVGGVAVNNGRIQNSTISGNVVQAAGMQTYSYQGAEFGGAAGGVFALASLGGGSVSVENSTVAFNRVVNAPANVFGGGGITVGRPFSFVGYFGGTYEGSVTLGVRNTIIARNTSNVGGPDVAGAFVSGGHNLIGVLTADASGFVASDLKGTAASPLDPKLRPLAFRGGPTQTHALMPGSPAINAGDNSGAPATDQRGKARIQGGVIDIGAYESGVGADDDRDDRDDQTRARWDGGVSVSAASLFALPDFPDGRPRWWFLRGAADRSDTQDGRG